MTFTIEPQTIESFIDKIKNIDLSKYEKILNPHIFDNSDIESFIVVLLILIIAYKLFHKAYQFVSWCICLLFTIEIGYLLGLSSLNNYIPFSDIFTYDIGVSVANFFAGTKLASGILYIHELLHISITQAGDIMAQIYARVSSWFAMQ